MSWESKVVWYEGLFLQPHHFQQADRHTAHLVSGLAERSKAYLWGVSELEIDSELLKIGKIAIKRVSGLLQDGTVFRVPENDDHPDPLIVPEGYQGLHRLSGCSASAPGGGRGRPWRQFHLCRAAEAVGA